MLAASVENQQVCTLASQYLQKQYPDTLQAEHEINEVKSQQRQIVRRMTNTTEPRAAIEAGNFKLQYVKPFAHSPTPLN